jgi:ribosome-associated heat shock protein Hsp15
MRDDRQRLDKWLWFARFAKSRTLAGKLIASGFVRVNGQRADGGARPVAVGDVVTLALQRTTIVVKVLDLGRRRGPAPEARLLYEDLTRDEGPLVSGNGKG